MDRKIPSDEEVKEAIRYVVKTRKIVESQEELCELALRFLRKKNEKYVLSPLRAKRIALSIPEIEVKAKTKKVPQVEKIERCPICDSDIVPIKVKNLLNEEIIIGYKCTSCGYQSDLEAFIPMKYIFLWKEK